MRRVNAALLLPDPEDASNFDVALVARDCYKEDCSLSAGQPVFDEKGSKLGGHTQRRR